MNTAKKEKQKTAMAAMLRKFAPTAYFEHNPTVRKLRCALRGRDRMSPVVSFRIGVCLQHACFFSNVNVHERMFRDAGLWKTDVRIKPFPRALETEFCVLKPFSRRGRNAIRSDLVGSMVLVPNDAHPRIHKLLCSCGLFLGTPKHGLLEGGYVTEIMEMSS